MKKTFLILAVAGISALITYLAVTRHLIQERAANLDRALQEAEARIVQLESDVGKSGAGDQKVTDQRALKYEWRADSQPTKVPAQDSGADDSPGQVNTHPQPSTSGGVAAAPGQPAEGGGLARFVTVMSAGTTNLIRIEGTSSLHAWQVEGRLIGGMAEIEPGSLPGGGGQMETDKPINAKIASFLPVRSLKSVDSYGSPYSTVMDEIMLQKLRADTHPRISFTLSTLAMKEPVPDKPGVFVCEALGKLAVAGKTNDIKMPVVVSSPAKDRLQFAGVVRLKMTDFGISPPSPSLAGVSIKTGDEVDVRFMWTVGRK